MPLSGNREWLIRALLVLLVATPCLRGDEDLFEKSVRPLFAAKCAVCHGSEQQMGGLDLSSAEGFAKGGARGALVSSANPSESLLLKVLRHEGAVEMPPTGRLPSAELDAVSAWVRAGAVWPERSLEPVSERHWSFEPVRVQASAENQIDDFLNAKLEAAGAERAQPAERLTLLRRATLDLTGLPPTPAEIEAFLADERPDAFARVVDRLLASPRYGERWGRHWLDVARYADSTGADEDHRYPHAWRYRDYVIRAFNSHKPYDQFVREQIAGDLLPSDGFNSEGVVATGFLALGPKLIAEIDKPKMFYDAVDEQIEVTSKAFLGLTLACARCHDHKFDPLTTKDYYAMASIFASTKNWAKVEGSPVVSTLYERPLVPLEQERAYEQAQQAIDDKKDEMKEVLAEAARRYRDARMSRVADSMLAAFDVYDGGYELSQVAMLQELEEDILDKWVKYLKPTAERRPQLEPWYEAKTAAARHEAAAAYQQAFVKTARERDAVLEAWEGEAAEARAAGREAPEKPRFFAGDDRFFAEVSSGPYGLPKEDRDRHMTAEASADLARLQAELKGLEESAPQPPLANAVNEGEPVRQHVFLRGDPRQHGDLVPKRFPTVLAGEEQQPIASGSGRLELAHWIASEDNPLTARVMANRIWLWHFGKAIVPTPNNFGRIGEAPTHPKLLDYLASEFVRSGWSIPHMHRLIMLSDAYRMSSNPTPSARENDPDNRLFSRFPTRRLTVEEIRDGLLTLDGSLNTEMYGALMKGEGTDKEFSDARKSLHPDQTQRRTVYLPLRRSNLPTLFSLFDFGDAVTSNPKRSATNVAPQALYMMNSDFVAERAEAFANLLLQDASLDPTAKLAKAHLLTLSRPPDEAWLALATEYLAGYPGEEPERAWTSLCRTLIASNEFLYVQ